MQVRTIISFILAFTFFSIFLVIVAGIALLLINDVIAGALVGKPETGWGFLIAQFFLSPFAALAFAGYYFSNNKFVSYTQNPLWFIPIISFVFTALFAAGYYLFQTMI